ncbi:unnamed protein product [Paramecium octaurelia]|uniref:Transmembrane protein n=1 Tax=Paramecium octaurelia TaxID=43137 RepID=A0A8S1UYW2_PAROT|nr:unnamed protein product [Paramecium octaurelia]
MKKFCLYLFEVKLSNKIQEQKHFAQLAQVCLKFTVVFYFQKWNLGEYDNNFKRQGSLSEYLLILRYFDPEKLCQLSQIFLKTILIIGLCFPLFIFCLRGISIAKTRNLKNKSTSIKVLINIMLIQLFSLCIDLYYWCLFQPFIQVQLEVLLINHQVMDWNSMLKEDYKNVVFIGFLSLFGLLLNTLMMILILLLFYKNVNLKIDFLSLVVNEDWEIVETTKQLKNIFEYQFNLLLSCPKLLLVSKYQNLLQLNDYELFQIQTHEMQNFSKQKNISYVIQKQMSRLNGKIFDEINQEKQFNEQFIKENEVELEKRQKQMNSNLQNKNIHYFYILILIPIQFKRMQEEYFNLIINSEIENYNDYSEDSIMKKQSIILKNDRKKITLKFQLR